VPAIIDDELDAELTMNDADPTTPFYMFVHAGHRRLGEVGHYVRRITKGLARVVSIDTKRRGYAHNILLPRVFAWLARLAMLSLCIGIILSGPCETLSDALFELRVGRVERFSIVNLVIVFEGISSVAELVPPPIYMLRCQRSSRWRKRSELVENIGYSRN